MSYFHPASTNSNLQSPCDPQAGEECPIRRSRVQGLSILPQAEGGLVAEAEQVLVRGGGWRLVGEQHDNGSEPVAAPLAFPHQPLLDEAGGGLAAGFADELEVGGVGGPLF